MLTTPGSTSGARPRVLVVDDEAPIRRALRVNLAARGYEVVEATDGDEALEAATNRPLDLVLLDLGLPTRDGLDVLRALRRTDERVAVVVLTVRDSVRSKIDALDAGADDYITKPFSIDELLARVRAVLRRRADPGPGTGVITTGAFTIDLGARLARRRDPDRPIHLTPTEWTIVEHLVRHPSRLVTQRQLVTAVWGPDTSPEVEALRLHLSHIRRKLEPDPARPRHLVTEPGAGYRFVPDPPIV